ncbi:MAG: CRTAC1 family protein [Acidobacteria bacterium]|nr:CRTAC1 family protein [Acidobacteriota bacterium]
MKYAVFCVALAAAAVNAPRFVDAGWIDGVQVSGDPLRKQFLYETTGGGIAIFDYDLDGRNDVLVVNGAGARSMLYRNEGGGKFKKSELPGDPGWDQGVCVADYDNDGRPDVFVARYGFNVLYRNTTSGFVSAPLPAQMHRWGAGCAFLDFDRDGRLDIFVSNYAVIDPKNPLQPGANPNCMWKELAVACGPKGLPHGQHVLLRQMASGAFEDVSIKAGIRKPGGCWGLGVAAADFNNDGWPDVYVACDQTPSLLYENKRDGSFVERGVEAGVAFNNDGNTQAGMGVAVADFDGDGFLDIAKTNFSGELPSLYRNEDGRFFQDIAAAAGLGANLLLGWGVAFVDIDDDGLRDLVTANGHVYPDVDRTAMGDRYRQKALLYRNLGGRKFADISASAGPAFQGLRASRALAVGDLDGDGRPEIVIGNIDAAPSVLKNESPSGNFVNIVLRGRAIGARVRAGGQIDELMSGGSYFSSHEAALHFGLGAAKVVERVSVRWPSGKTQEWKGLPVNARCELTEASPAPSCKSY